MNIRQTESNHSVSACLWLHREMSAERLAHLTVLVCLVFVVHRNLPLGHLGLQTRTRMIVLHPRQKLEGVTLSLAGFHHLLQGPCHPAAVLGCRKQAQTRGRQLVFSDARLSSLYCQLPLRICILLASMCVYGSSLRPSVDTLGMNTRRGRQMGICIHQILVNVGCLPCGIYHCILCTSSSRLSELHRPRCPSLQVQSLWLDNCR